MGKFGFNRLLDTVAGMDLLVALLWLGLASLTIALLVLMRTRFGQARPLRKCLVLSLLAHLLLAGYATTVHIVSSVPLQGTEPVFTVSINEEASARELETRTTVMKEKPWESFVHEAVVQPAPAEAARLEAVANEEPQRQPRSEQVGVHGEPSMGSLPLDASVQPEPKALPAVAPSGPAKSTGKAPEPVDAPSAQRREGVRAEVPVRPQVERGGFADAPRPQPQRQSRAGVPSALLEQPLPAPRLTNVPATPDPERALPDAEDSLTKARHGKPAEWPDRQAAPTDRPPQVASTAEAGPVFRSADELKPPSIAARGGVGPLGSGDDPALHGTLEAGPPLLPGNRRSSTPVQIPAIYRLRVAPDRSRIAQVHGATPESEAAVKAALKWLAGSQASDGHWDAQTHGAGRELFVAGRDRQAAGIQANTGITGLALLAFLASGHTHLEGDYRPHVRRGLQYLLDAQAYDGNLGGNAGTYAFMYCHAMATFALSEAYAMTGDQRLREPIQRAVSYTIAAQDPSGGGWRYNPRDAGDTSQLGWQLMALKSAELAGIPIPDGCRQRALRFLESVSSGQYGGLAAYRPVERASRAMTAEALVCRIFLGMSPDHPAGGEAADYLLGELPGQGARNLYYWYYGTLGMYQLQGVYWERWNYALQQTLVSSQQKSGPLAGSWNPDTTWGGYGGRVYTTALATLCLEVYYRFLPLYLQAAVPRHPLR